MKTLIFDIETTGLDIVNDRIVQIAIIIIENGKETTYKELINPTIPISFEASQIHGIEDVDVINEPTFENISNELYSIFKDANRIITHNGLKFDIPFLLEEFARCKIGLSLSNIDIVDTLQLETKLNPRTLDGLYLKYTNENLDNVHDAMVDAMATKKIFEKQFEILYKNHNINKSHNIESFIRDGKPRTDIANKFTYIEDELCWNFGKYNNKPVTVDLSYNDWFFNADFPNESKIFLYQYLKDKNII